LTPNVSTPRRTVLALLAALGTLPALALLVAGASSGAVRTGSASHSSTIVRAHHPCGGGTAVPVAASAVVTNGPATTLRGAVRVWARQDGWVIRAPLAHTASYVTRRFPASTGVAVEFCLRAPRGAQTTLLRLEPGRISVALRRGHLELEVPHPGRVRRLGRSATVAGHPIAVDLVVDGNGRRVDLYVNGTDESSYTTKPLAPASVQLGSLAPARASLVTLTGVTVTTCAGTVIPAPGRAGSPPGTPPQGSPAQGSPGQESPPGGGPTVAPGSSSSTGSSSLPPACSDAADTAMPWPGNPFAPTSVWNAPLATNAPLDSQSQAYVNELVRQVQAYGPWLNTTANSVPVYVVGASQPMQHVTLDAWGPDLQSTFDAVPIPCNAKPSAGPDEQMAVWQPSTDEMWEFFEMRQEPDGWHTAWGGEIDNVSSSPGYFDHVGRTTNWGATATGLPLLGGLVTAEDLKRGYIDHALAISLVETARAVWSWPAQRTDGGYFSSGITPIPEGTRFRLAPNIDVASLNLPPIDRMLAQAAQTYGIVVRDKAGAVTFYGQDPTNLPANPWPTAFGNQYPNNVLKLFPWQDLQALQTQLSCCWHP
jgi:hypothetical protein